MCGRFTLATELDALIDRFDIAAMRLPSYQARYNIAPTQEVVAVINDGMKNRLGYLKWGLVPPWAKEPAIGTKMINARAETIMEKPSFKKPFQRQRCLVLADSFYEWKRTDEGKIPMRITVHDGEPFAMAGLWERWRGENGQELSTCTVITTRPNEVMKPIHDRMPVILSPENEKLWIDPRNLDTELLSSLLQPSPDEWLTTYPVSTLVNATKNDGVELLQKKYKN